MTQDKELLLKDLCARLPYGVKYECSDIKNIWKLNAIMTKRQDDGVFLDVYNPLDLCKPYLFPLSSMTEEQKYEYDELIHLNNIKAIEGVITNTDCSAAEIDWCNKNQFDYRGLIPKGLAIDATGLNIY